MREGVIKMNDGRNGFDPLFSCATITRMTKQSTGDGEEILF
jgi:hypothetical protein